MTLGLTWNIVAWVLLADLLHASWNVLVKSSSDKALDIALIQMLAPVIALPIVCFVGWPPLAAWPFIIGSTIIHLAYRSRVCRAML